MATPCDVDLGSLSLDELEAELATLASHLYAGTCRWLELVCELDRRSGWAGSGRASLSEWLAWRCALTPRAAREHVRVARRLPELPLVHAAFARGELSYAKVRALTRVASAANEEELLDLAAGLTAAQLERAVSAYRRVTTAEARDLQESTYLAVSWEPDGSLSLRGRLAPEDGALLLRALEAMRDARWREERGSAEPPPARPATNAAARVARAPAAHAPHGAGPPGGARYQIVVHTDESALAHDSEGGCQLDDGPALAAETARRLACDASITRNGRKTRTIPPPLRRALKTRDRGCRFPGCDNRRFLDAHHLHHWARGGPTTLTNLVLLCRRHHQLVHEGGWHIDQRARFHDPRGHPLPAAPPLPRGHPDQLPGRNGDPLHLADAVHALLAISPYRVAFATPS